MSRRGCSSRLRRRLRPAHKKPAPIIEPSRLERRSRNTALVEYFVEFDADEAQHDLGINLEPPLESFDRYPLVVAVEERSERNVAIEFDRREPVACSAEQRVELVVGRARDHPRDRTRTKIVGLYALADEIEQ